MSRGQWGLLSLWSLAMGASLVAYFWEDDGARASDTIAILAEKKGTVDYRRPNFGVWSAARQNQGFEKGTFVATAKHSTAKIKLGQNHIIDIAEDSQIVIGSPEGESAATDYFVGVLKGNLKVGAVPEAQPRQGAFALAAKAFAPSPSKELRIQAGSVSASVDGNTATVLSIARSLREEPKVTALQGLAIIKNVETGVETTIGTPDSAKVAANATSGTESTPEETKGLTNADDIRKALDAFSPPNGRETRSFVTFLEAPRPITIPLQLQSSDPAALLALQEFPEIRVAFNSSVSRTNFLVKSPKDSQNAPNSKDRALVHELTMNSEEIAQLLSNGTFETELRPAIEREGEESIIASKPSVRVALRNLKERDLAKVTLRLQGPRLKTGESNGLPLLAEIFSELEKTEAIFVPKAPGAGLTTRRLISGSRSSAIDFTKDTSKFSPTVEGSGTPQKFHFVRGQKTLASLVSFDPSKSLNLQRALQTSLGSDFFYSGEEQMIFPTASLTSKEWTTFGERRRIHALCDGKQKEITGVLLRSFPRSQDLVTTSCRYVFDGKVPPRIFEPKGSQR